MKRTLITIIPLFAVLGFGIGFNIYNHQKSKIDIMTTSKYCFGCNIDYMENKGCNYFCYVWKNKKDGHIVGNWKDGFCTWYMNK